MKNEIKKLIEDHIRKVINGRHIIDLTVDEKLSFFHFDNNGYSYAIEFKKKDLIECIEEFKLNVLPILKILQMANGELDVKEREEKVPSNDYDLLNEPDIVAECIGNGMHFTVESITKRVVTNDIKKKLNKMFSWLGKEGRNV